MEYIDLKRIFSAFDEMPNTEEAIYFGRQWSSLLSHRAMNWDDLLENRFVVVLGEAGTGKTTEFQERAQILQNRGQSSFFIPIEDLADERILINDEKAINTWKSNSGKGVFLLDSVDEARLVEPRALERAIDHLARILETSCHRAYLIVSCRISDWQYITDQKTLKSSLLPFHHRQSTQTSLSEETAIDNGKLSPDEGHFLSQEQQDPTTEEITLKIVQLLPLKEDQISQLAQTWGLTNNAQFLDNLKDDGLQMFAARPRDLEWLVDYWKKHDQFASFYDMIALNVREKLREQNNIYQRKGEPVSPERLRNGVEWLAAASMLCNKLTFSLPESALINDSPVKSLQPHEVLSDWSDQDIKALLNRAVFDPVILGRVRFHDPTIRDFLAACWATKRLDKGYSRSAIQKLFFGQIDGKERPIPSKRMVLGWLANMVPEIRRKLVTVAPDVLLYCGDASQVPVEERAQGLRSLATLLQNIGHTEWTVYDEDIKRIADPGLSKVVLELIPAHVDNPEMGRLLLRLIELGKLSECAQSTLDIIQDPNLENVRVYAIRAVAQSGSHEQHQVLKKIAFEGSGWSNSVLGIFCSALFPKIITVQECVALASKGVFETPDASSGLGVTFLFKIIEACPETQLTGLLQGLFSLASTKPMIKDRGKELLSERYLWTINPIIRVFTRLLKTQEQPGALNDLIQVYGLLSRCHNIYRQYYLELDDLKISLKNRSDLHQHIFWKTVRERFASEPNDPNPWQSWREILELDIQDVGWILKDAALLEEAEEIRTAFNVVLVIWQSGGRPKSIANDINTALSASRAQQKTRDEVMQALQTPPSRPTQVVSHIQEQKEEKKRLKKLRDESRETLQKEIDAIRQGDHFSYLYYLYSCMEREKSNGSRLTQSNWQSLIPDFGKSIAQAAREGFKQTWKNWKPPLPYARDDDRKIENGVIVGLIGLAIAVEDGFDFSHLTEEEASIAAHYALREMNQFPPWIEALAMTYPQPVQDVLSRQIEAELTSASTDPYPGQILQQLRNGPGVVRELCQEKLLDLLAQQDPPQKQSLENSLMILIQSNVQGRLKIGAIAHDRVKHNIFSTNQGNLILWLIAWLQVDGEAALEFLVQVFEPKKPAQDDLIIDLAAELGERGDYGKEVRESSWFFRLDLMKKMILLLNRHIRTRDLPIRTGVYTPNALENADRFLSWMFQYLAQQTGTDARKVLREISEEISPDLTRKWVRTLLEKQAGLALESPAWASQDVVSVGSLHEKDPSNANDLYQIALDRLLDIKSDIESGDFSERALFSSGMPESHIQHWLAGRLDRESRSRYSVVREEETDRNKKTDIRLHNAQAGLVSIEIKPVDGRGYSLQKLLDTLEKQLVGQYMQAARSHHGILMIAMLKKRTWVLKDGRGQINFEELLSRLNKKADEIERIDNHVNGLKVVGIDFVSD